MVVCTAVTAGLSAIFADRRRLTICCRQCNSFYMIDVFRFFLFTASLLFPTLELFCGDQFPPPFVYRVWLQ